MSWKMNWIKDVEIKTIGREKKLKEKKKSKESCQEKEKKESPKQVSNNIGKKKKEEQLSERVKTTLKYVSYYSPFPEAVKMNVDRRVRILWIKVKFNLKIKHKKVAVD